MRRVALACVDHLFLTRPVLLTPVWAAYLLGSRAARAPGGAGWVRVAPSRGEWEGLLLVTLVTAALYILNQLVDRPVDRLNRKLFLLSDGIVSPRSAAIEAAAMIVLAGVVAVRTASRAEITLLALALATGVAYSVPPVRLKARAVGDLLANACCYGGFTFLLGWCGGGGVPGARAVLHAAPYVLASGALFLLSTLEDEAGDREAGLRTSAVAWGGDAVRRVTFALSLAVVPAAAITREWPALAWSLAAAPLYAVVVARGGLDRGFRVNQVAGRLMVLLAVPGALVLAAAILLLTVASRVYYRRRFGLRYPRMSLEAGLDAR